MPPDSDNTQIVLFYPTQSLIEQISELVASWSGLSVVVSAAARPQSIRQAAAAAVATIIDATEDPARGARVLSAALPAVGPRRLAVYTEVLHPGLELFVRVRGPFLLVGPMKPRQWSDYLAYATQTPVTEQVRLVPRSKAPKR
ncbi:MAG: hypothetical protein ACP5HU_11900 [Phycisphaerae bacterium]